MLAQRQMRFVPPHPPRSVSSSGFAISQPTPVTKLVSLSSSSMLRHPWRGQPLALHRRHLFTTASRDVAPAFDYIIVGAGSAGCVLANRLSADRSNKVLLVEAGPSDRNRWDSFLIAMPAAIPINLTGTRYNWNFTTEPQEFLNRRKVVYPSGRVLGGSSSLNAMIYSRGHAKDYDEWQRSGAHGWSYAECLPYFQRCENHQLGRDEYRGGDGPLHLVRNTQTNQPLFQAFLDAGVEAGYPFTDNLNGYQQEGFGWQDMTIHQGKRWSTSAAYLHPVMHRENLTVMTETFVNKVLFEGKKAIGIETEDVKSKAKAKILTSNEVILSSGAIKTPQVLMLSGVGDADHLKEWNVPLVHHVPAVGKHMMDHIGVNLHIACKQPVTLYNASKRYPGNVLKIGYEWVTSKTGPGASPHCEVGAFIRTASGKEQPDLQIIFSPCTIDLQYQMREDIGHAMSGHICLLRDGRNGTITLRSANPRDPPRIDPKYLSREDERVTLRESVKLAREIFAQKALAKFTGDGISPRNSVRSDDEIDAWLRKYAGGEFHLSCTARMGNDEDSVVDSHTRVHGMDGLRIVDASIMPNIVSGNTNGAVIMMAEKAADIILGQPALPKASVPVYQPSNWQNSQR